MLLLFPVPCSLFPLSAFAAPTTIKFRGQDISYEGAKIEWVGDPTAGDAELILIYTNCAPDAVNTFEPSRAATARVLAIGGGGAGGTVRSSSSTSHPGGGGGGAGEFLDRVGVPFAAEKVGILVGLGGAATGVSGTQSAGENGKPSAITNLTATLILVNGGGGGGGESVGQPGGSGGGGSNTDAPGGEAVKNEEDGCGNSGGTSSKRAAGGGGGAGTIGGNGSNSTTSGTGGKGGDGRSSDIWLDKDGNVRWYAGGGGGGLTISGTVGAGGEGGGGQGGAQSQLTVATAAPTSGEPFTGSGGGGGGRYWPGAAGGSGIVIIRLTGIEQPKIWKAVKISRGGFDGYIFIDSNAEEPKTLGTGDAAELVLTYTDPYNGGGLSFTLRADMELIPAQEAERAKYSVQIPIWANARILAVGGGGGGGMINVRGSQRGGGGGGGAGGFVESSGHVFDTNEVYSIAVGKGGKGGERNEAPGENGGDSSVTAGTMVFGAVARGGGGGGAGVNLSISPAGPGLGRPGGSGGGGSCDTGGVVNPGGDGTSGQGFAGGTGANTYAGGGGGGAGSAGGTTGSGVAGDGGAGKSSDITGTTVWYAGGGGGAYVNTPDAGYTKYQGGAGGFGDDGKVVLGGRGAGNRDKSQDFDPIPAADGVANTGSGGGGGVSHASADEKAGDGGHGIVIIRLSGIIVRAVPLPKPQGPFTYDGNAHTGVVEFYAYTLTGTPVATNADWYTVTATMEPGASYTWADWHEGDPEEKKWGPRDVSWCINQMRVPQPAAVSSRVYNGEEQYPVDKDGLHLDDDGYCSTDEGLKYCFLTETHKATDAAAYHFTAQLVKVDPQGNFATNFVWSNNSSMADRDYTWYITQAPNKIIWTSPYLGYLRSRLDTPAKPHHPLKHVKSAWGLGGATVEYRAGEGEGQGEGEGWKAWPPPAKGNYELRITIVETPNWQGDSVTTGFGTWDRLADLYSDQMDVKVSGKGDSVTELTGFPVPVRVREPDKDGYSEFSGFSYGRAGATGTELHFFDSNGDPIEHEVDTWNTHGESLLWVRVPTLKSNNVKVLTMCWRRVSDIMLPAYNPEGVWVDYSGVWHFSKQESGVWTDSSGNDLHAHLTAGGKATAIDGKFGKALYVGTGDVIIDGYNELNNTTNFMFSGWYRNDQGTAGNFNFAGTKMGQAWNASPGWSFHMETATKVDMSAAGNRDGYDFKSAIQSDFQHLAYVVPNNNANRYAYFNGANQKSKTGDIGLNAQPLQLAGTKFSCDEVRLRKTAPANYAAWAKEEYNSLNNASYCTCGLVKIDCDKYNAGNGLICDWWETVPSLAKTVWREGETWPEEKKGSYVPTTGGGAGTAITATYRQIPDGTPTTVQPTAKGHYRATYDHSSPASYRPQPHTIDFYIIEATVPVYDIGGNGGDSGRILLMNADNNAKASVTNQGWCARSETGVTYWKTLEGGEGTNNVMPGTWFDLVRSADKNVLWHLADCRQGNTFPTNDNQALTAVPWNSYCYLPASSSTALSITNEDVKATRGSTGWVLMRNIAKETEQKDQGGPEGPGACVYSPCYSNGIGTVYFDAVNGLKAQGDRAEAFRIVLEIATENDAGDPPFDTNCWFEAGGITNRYGRLNGMWRPVEMSPMFVSSSTYTDQPATNCLALKVTQGGGMDQFYRVHAFVGVHKPCRFRIRRVSVDETVTDEAGQPNPDDAYILLDNIIASFPPVVAELKPYGSFDGTLDGDRAIGYGGAFESPFPSAAEGASLTGRCAVAFTDGYTPSAESFTLKQMFYRWRYLGQLSDPTDGDWAATDLTEAGGELRTAQPLATPAEPGDIEFYFVTVLKTPYYGYVDYSGNRPVSAAGYTEEGLPHESRFERKDDRLLASGGTDWYVRLRDGIVRDETDRRYENLLLLTRPSGGGPVETNVFDIIGDNQVVARLRMRNPLAAGLDFRIEGLNPQVPGSREYAFSTDFWKADARVASFPLRVNLESCGADDWSWVACDGATGFLYFQLDFGNKTLQVAHAEAENFEKWSSAVNPDGLFVGSAVDTNSSSAVTREWVLDWSQWSASIATDSSWQEGFTGAGAGSEWNKPFSTARTPHGWTAESALWTYGKWSQQATASMTITVNDDVAAQLEGRGKGRLSFIDASKVPDGLDTVTYRARVGQVSDFKGFTWYDWYLGTSFDDMVPTKLMSNYTVATIAALTPSGADSYDGDGSVSLVGYYNGDFGCYEFRVSRGKDDKDLRLALFRWSKSGDGYVCEKLLDENTDASKRKNFFDYSNKDATTGAGCCADRLVKNSKTLYGGLFLSVMEDAGKTLVTAGVCETDVSTLNDPSSMFGDQSRFTCLTYHDNSAARLTKGTFGVQSCNCPALFAKPVCYTAGVQSYKPSKAGFLQSATGKSVILSGDRVAGTDTDAYYTRWEKPGRLERISADHGDGVWGFQTAAITPQELKVQISDHGASKWVDATNAFVKGFASQTFRHVIHDPRSCDVRLQVGDAQTDARTDIVIDDVSLTQWNGQWTPHWDDGSSPWRYLTNDFVYTSAWVLENSGRRSLKLQPSRAKNASTPVSLRSPMMRGLGLIHFAWRDADPRAKIRVQYREDVTETSLATATETLGEGGTDGWTTFATIPVGEIGASGSQTVCINRRYDGKDDRGRDYRFGLIRLVIDEDVEAEAISGNRRRTDPEYGAVTITDAFVWDYPEYDKFGWNGWNFRAAGWVPENGPEPDAFANIRDSFRGLSGLLNNTLDADTLADRDKGHYSQRLPSVQSPAFRTNCVGALSFRARLYDADDQRLAGHPAVVTVYGCKTVDDRGEPVGEWKEICDVEVSNRTYAVHSVKVPATLECKAIRLAVKGVKGVTDAGTPAAEPILRVALDDIVIWERLSQSLAFRKAFVRPFRDATAIKGSAVVQDIDKVAEQPLIGESFGFQAEVEVLDPDEVITGDPAHPITVDLSYYQGSDVWGYENWRTNPAAVKVLGLTPATDGKGLVFRSTVEQSASLCPPQFLEEGEGYRIVQYHVTAHYYVQGDDKPGVHELQSSEWSMPAWNTGFKDPNGTNTAFSAFTLLEEIAPGRAWINEVNYCEKDDASSKVDQWVEIAVPSGVDMTGWKLRLYDLKGHIADLLTFGATGPAKKPVPGGDPSHYDFYVVKSPNSTLAADATWSKFTASSVDNGKLKYSDPYGFELVRPTGVAEHSVVVQGWNQYYEAGYDFAWQYDGTNLVKVLDKLQGNPGKWVWAAEDYHVAPGCTVGVVTNQGMLHVEWKSPMGRSPGTLNEGQYIDPDWFILPNGGYVKIYSTILGGHMRQIIGGVTNTVGDITISQGLSTSIVYEVDRWYKLGPHEVKPDEHATWSGPRAEGGKSYWTLNLNLVSNRIDVTASAAVSDDVEALMNAKYPEYRPAIMSWLEKGVTGNGAFRNPDGPLQPGYYRGNDFDRPWPSTESNRLDLVDMYWLDMDPTAGGWEMWGGMGDRPGSPGSLGPVNCEVIRTNGTDVTQIHTNILTTVWLELRNDGWTDDSGAASPLSYPPYRLQGLANEQSDSADFSGSWTSETFKVTMRLMTDDRTLKSVWRPMRYFVFNGDSFRPKDDPVAPYAARIEITDPFSRQSPAWEWGWWRYADRGLKPFSSFRLNGEITPGGVTTLKKDDFLEF